ncbi:hypothetical protein TNIN_112051 [Trichonephila inaurata madagascariensis]|uniref:Uncharacterized protein n=1 Tax=Trichonephila inaurata madagascariensis TaxID=2747483 RepID=A0A8X7BWW8_9ARAC|nr:hypothetical protein TNIN_112051 [Trichonephila inaurata madagascariensis]
MGGKVFIKTHPKPCLLLRESETLNKLFPEEQSLQSFVVQKKEKKPFINGVWEMISGNLHILLNHVIETRDELGLTDSSFGTKYDSFNFSVKVPYFYVRLRFQDSRGKKKIF